jgi:hypothetical protein
MWTLRGLRNIELGLAAKRATQGMLRHQIETGCYRDNDLARVVASLVEYERVHCHSGKRVQVNTAIAAHLSRHRQAAGAAGSRGREK